MKSAILTSLIIAAMGCSLPAMADSHTVSLGYAQSKVQDFKNIRGVNAKYRYEWDSPVSIIGSLTYMSGKRNSSTDYPGVGSESSHAGMKYYSLSAGPAYRINSYISIYGLLGINYDKADFSYSESSVSGSGWESSGNSKKAALMYGAGVQINPMENIAIDIGYEGSSFKDVEKTLSINGFNIGVGYRF
ncbi:Ail/Lom family outer membrane beta-barrel protein [Tatumella citrea]|uniref:Virulence protein n=1 Tax=Tatumella citrea TaxID=53336 RepID=A0A1Y0LF63_TATCI|nr:Ail/Lom family outer membrane beta-barrel protein [Tatumella citrea]ARU92686.1 virulence protein [Tatumella citrea]ARU96723.1 virulence protein [Tatumella citrea]